MSAFTDILGGVASVGIPFLSTAAQIGLPIAQLISAKANNKRAVLPASVDSRMSTHLAELNNMRAGLSTGNAYRGFLDSLDDQRAEATARLTKATGGNFNAAITGSQRLNEAFGDSASKFGANALDTRLGYDNLIGQETQKISDREYNLQQQNYLQQKTEATQNKQAGFSNLFAALEDLSGIDIPGKKVDEAGLLDRTAYSSPSAELESLSMGGPGMATGITTPSSPVDSVGFGDSYFNPQTFGSNFLKSKKYSLSF